MNKWFCTICYHEHEGEKAPESCIACGAHPKSIIQTDDKSKVKSQSGLEGVPDWDFTFDLSSV